MRRATTAGIVLGMGLGGFVDGIVLHQLLQWHHLLSDAGEPGTTVSSLERNTFWDGAFHAATWLMIAAGISLLWRAASRGEVLRGRRQLGTLLAGWGAFNLVEGIVDHHVLTIHHVRDDVADSLPWDLGFLAFGVVLLLVGWALARSGGEVDVRDLATPAAATAPARTGPGGT